jgi:hypothetical protein
MVSKKHSLNANCSHDVKLRFRRNTDHFLINITIHFEFESKEIFVLHNSLIQIKFEPIAFNLVEGVTTASVV